MTYQKSLILGGVLMFASLFGSKPAKALEVGTPAPVVEALTDTGTKLKFSDLYKDEFVLVYFYPKADTPGCTAQACSLRDSYQVLQNKGVRVVGVSTDKVKDQKQFKDKYHLPFTLIADTEKAVTKAFEVPTTLGFASRQAFLIHNGKLAWVDKKASTAQQAADVLKVLETIASTKK